MNKNRVKLLASVYEQALQKNNLEADIPLDDFVLHRFDYQYLKGKGLLMLNGKPVKSATITAAGVDVVEHIFEQK